MSRYYGGPLSYPRGLHIASERMKNARRISSHTRLGDLGQGGLATVKALGKVFALSMVLTLALASAALADQLTNEIDSSPDAALENMTLNEGESQTVAFSVAAQGNDLDAGCNIDEGESLTVQVISSNTSVATVSPQTLTFTECHVNQSVTLTAGASGTSIITVVQDLGVESNTTGLGTFDYTSASFTATVNSPPTISDITDQSTTEDTPTGDIPFTVGDSETPAADLTLAGSSSNTTLVPNANITFGGSDANRTVMITPAANQYGTATITVSVSDGSANTEDTFVLTVNAVNDTPHATDDARTTNEDNAVANLNVLGNDTDADGDSLGVSSFTQPSNGTVTRNADNTLEYVPNTNFNGTDSFTYKANDGTVDSNSATVNITVNAVNDAPVADSQSISTDEDTSKAITLNASDIEGDNLSYSIVAGPSHGTLSGSGAERTYNPDANYNGSDSFTFKANDGSADSNVATVSITVNAVNDAPAVVGWAPKGTNVSVRAKPTVIFSERMDEASVEARNASGMPTTFTLKKGTTKIKAKVAYIETTNGVYKAVLTPARRLRSGATYTATVTTGAKDLEGAALAAKKVWKFSVK